MKSPKDSDEGLFDLFYHHVISHPGDPYISCNGRTFTYDGACSVIFEITQLIRNRDNRKSNCVALNFKDQQKLLFSFWACAALETDIVLIPELSLNVNDLKAAGYNPEIDIMLSDFVEGPDCHDIDVNAVTGITSPRQRSINDPSARKNIFFFTSGTTGKSKFIKTSYYQLIRAINCIRENNIMPYTFLQNVLIIVPLFHSYGLSAMVEYTGGGSHLFLPKLKDHISPLQSLLEVTTAEQITAIEGVPYFYKQAAVILNRLKLPNLKHIGLGGDSVSPELLKKFHDKISNVSFSIRYGITEIPSVIGVNYFQYHEQLCTRSLGKILPIYKLALFNENNALSESEGELVVNCFIYPGYAVHIHTNDLAELSGSVFTFKTRKVFIKYRGYKINPAEIEEYLNKYKDITDSRVYLLNEVLTADIISSGDPHPDVRGIKKFLAECTSVYLIPDQFKFVDAIERTGTGKILR